MLTPKLREFLERKHVDYAELHHPRAVTASESARLSAVPGEDFAKTVVVVVDGHLAMVLIPASKKLDVATLAEELGADVRLATEQEIAGAFPDCEVGAMPPFGNLYGMPVYVSAELTHEEDIAFNAGTHTDVVKMRYDDFARSVRPYEMPTLTGRW